MRRRTALALPALWLSAGAASTEAGAQTSPTSPPPEVAAAWPMAKLVGSGSLRFFGLRIYDAHLWSPRQLTDAAWPEQPLALSLSYHRDLAGRAIASRSLTEMQRQGPIEATQAERWLRALEQALPDVQVGDRLTALQRPGAAVQLFLNGAQRAHWPDALFARRFLGIWLDATTSEPGLREALLGGRG